LRILGYEVGSGSLVGLKNQTASDMARDIIFFKSQNFDMVGIGPFIPHKETSLANETPGEAIMVLKALALIRIVMKDINIPATTALGSLEKDFRIDALKAGANVIMPNFTPFKYRLLYELYPGKRCLGEEPNVCLACIESMAQNSGYFIDYSKGGRKHANHTA
jgi:biotin synthase